MILSLLSWNLAFKKTFNEIERNRSLTETSSVNADLTINPDYIKRKNIALNNLLAQYKVDSSEWKNGFWLHVSAIAENKGVEVIYRPAKNQTVDTAAYLKQAIQFKGDYKKLVLLVDSLEKTIGIGKLTSAELIKESKNNLSGSADKIVLNTDFKALKKYIKE